jgi:hypothetical protein
MWVNSDARSDRKRVRRVTSFCRQMSHTAPAPP